MNEPMPPSPLRQEDYLAIEAAVMETARGRWFLSEYARQNRNSDTDTLLAAIDKLEKNIVQERAPSSLMNRVKMDLADMAAAIEKTKQEIAQIKHEDNQGAERFERASSELDAIVSQTETATGDILGAAEKIQEYAWTMREQGSDVEQCDALDMEATNIYMACSFQDLTGQRIKKIVDAMRYVESRINSMIDIWGFKADQVEVEATASKPDDERPDAHLLNGPALAGEGIDQQDVDGLLNHGGADLDEESNQDDVDALFDSAMDTAAIDDFAPIEQEAVPEVSLDTIEFDAVAADDEMEPAEAVITTDLSEDGIGSDDQVEAVDPSEEAMLQTDVSTLLDDLSFDAVATDEAEAASVTEDVSGELEAETGAADSLTAQAEAVDEDYEFVDLDDLEWADAAQGNAEVKAVAADEAVVAEADDALSESLQDDASTQAGDVFASEPVDQDLSSEDAAVGDADIFASDPVLDPELQTPEMEVDAAPEVSTEVEIAEFDGLEADVFASSSDAADAELADDQSFTAVEEAMQKELDERVTQMAELKNRIADFS